MKERNERKRKMVMNKDVQMRENLKISYSQSSFPTFLKIGN